MTTFATLRQLGYTTTQAICEVNDARSVNEKPIALQATGLHQVSRKACQLALTGKTIQATIRYARFILPSDSVPRESKAVKFEFGWHNVCKQYAANCVIIRLENLI